MIKPKRVLIIFFRPPYPTFGGDKIRMYQNLKFLSENYQVDAIVLDEQRTQAVTINELNRYCNKVQVFHIPKYKNYVNTFLGLLKNRKPLQINYYYHTVVQEWINKNFENYDILFVNTIRTAEYVKNLDSYKVIDFIDSISMNYEKAANQKSTGLWRLFYKIDKVRAKDYEKKTLNVFNKAIIISEVDKSFILKSTYNEQKIKVIPNGVFLNTKKCFDSFVEKEIISFLGKMDYEPNITAVMFFVSKVFPIVKKVNPDIEFQIIGINPTKKIKALNKIEGVKVLGFVDNFEQYVVESKLIVAPMITGAGVQNKILQAMALGKCVITTKIGAEGLIDIDKSSIIIIDDALKMANEIITLFKDDGKRNSIGSNAKKYINDNYSKKMIKKEFLEYLEK